MCKSWIFPLWISVLLSITVYPASQGYSENYHPHNHDHQKHQILQKRDLDPYNTSQAPLKLKNNERIDLKPTEYQDPSEALVRKAAVQKFITWIRRPWNSSTIVNDLEFPSSQIGQKLDSIRKRQANDTMDVDTLNEERKNLTTPIFAYIANQIVNCLDMQNTTTVEPSTIAPLTEPERLCLEITYGSDNSKGDYDGYCSCSKTEYDGSYSSKEYLSNCPNYPDCPNCPDSSDCSNCPDCPCCQNCPDCPDW